MGRKPAVLCIMDGLGINENHEHNAVWEARTPNLDRFEAECPFVQGQASGLAVGLPDGQMGNSEVGHTNIGAGRVVYQELTRISKAIEDGDFFENPALLEAAANCRKNGSTFHIMGLVSPGGVHSHSDHLYGLLELARREGLTKVCVHAFLDGRDTAPTSGLKYVEELEEKMRALGVGRVASVMGRYYSMDRDNRWDRIGKAYETMTKAAGRRCESACEAIRRSYEAGKTDEFVEPAAVTQDGIPVGTVQDGDSLVFFNFRPDRAREVTRAFCMDGLDGFDRGPRPDITYVCFVDYEPDVPHRLVAFEKEDIRNSIGEYVAALGLRQLRIAETEKYAHVTFFFSGGRNEPFENEDRILVDSPRDVATYDLKPEMSAYGVCEKLCEAIRSGRYDLIVVNYANSDMVGHTGVESAAVKAVETVDVCVGRTAEAVRDAGGVMLICADHGNSEQMIDYETGEPMTAHTTNPVPFILVNAGPEYGLREGGRLCDLAPTLLELMGLPQPEEMTGVSLLTKN